MRTVVGCAMAAFCLTVAGVDGARAQGAADSLLRQLESSSPLKRSAAFGKLSGLSGALAKPGMGDVLRQLLDRENQLSYETLRESNGRTAVDAVYGEDYGEYVGRLFDACVQYCDMDDPRTIKVLVSGDFPDEGPIARKVATHGGDILTQMIEYAAAGKYGRQLTGVNMLGNIARYDRSLSRDQRRLLDSALVAAAGSASVIVPYIVVPALRDEMRDDRTLSDEERAAYHQGIIMATRSAYVDIRRTAVEALGAVGDKTDLPLLRQLAERDTARSGARGGGSSYPVRAVAQQAIDAISRRMPPP